MTKQEAHALATEALESLEAEGVMRKTGEYRRSKITGKMQPVYELKPEAELGELKEETERALILTR